MNFASLMKHMTLYKLLFRLRRILLGRTISDGLIMRAIVYALLVSIGFVYLYPILYMLSQSMKSLTDLLDPTVMWIPKELYFDNLVKAWKVLDFPKTLSISVMNSILPAVAQTLSCALVGYGFAKFRFPGKNLMFGLMLITFIIPTQVVMIPLYLLFQKYGMLGSPLPFIVPALFAGGLKSALFVLIYSQFFKTIPDSLEESAQLDGAGYSTIFFRIILPISVPSIVVVFLFSLVWHWNETYMASLYLGNNLRTLPLKLQTFNESFKQLYSSTETGSTEANINESIKMAGTMLIVLPLLILYAFMQKWFVEVIDKTGITGE